jgi:hypothetical protein
MWLDSKESTLSEMPWHGLSSFRPKVRRAIRHTLNVTFPALLHRHCHGCGWCDSERSILALCECLGVLNLWCSTFTLGACEHGPFGNFHVARDLARTNAGCVSGFDLLPSFVRDLSAHSWLDRPRSALSLSTA